MIKKYKLDINKIKEFRTTGIITEYVTQSSKEVYEFCKKYDLNSTEGYETLNIILHLEKTGVLISNPYMKKKERTK